jgi:hypothetical protein
MPNWASVLNEIQTCDNDLQDLVLTVHHAYMHTFSAAPAAKIVENHLGHAVVLNAPTVRQ